MRTRLDLRSGRRWRAGTFEGTSDEAAKARFEDRDLLRQFQEVERLPDSDKALVKSFLDAFLFKRKVEGLSAPERRESP